MMKRDDPSWFIIMIHHDESYNDPSWCIITTPHDEASWFIMMNHHDSSFLNHHGSSCGSSMMLHDDLSWCIMIWKSHHKPAPASLQFHLEWMGVSRPSVCSQGLWSPCHRTIASQLTSWGPWCRLVPKTGWRAGPFPGVHEKIILCCYINWCHNQYILVDTIVNYIFHFGLPGKCLWNSIGIHLFGDGSVGAKTNVCFEELSKDMFLEVRNEKCS